MDIGAFHSIFFQLPESCQNFGQAAWAEAGPNGHHFMQSAYAGPCTTPQFFELSSLLASGDRP
jgi:hypothetical protein